MYCDVTVEKYVQVGKKIPIHIIYRNYEDIYFDFNVACVYLPSSSFSYQHLARMLRGV